MPIVSDAANTTASTMRSPSGSWLAMPFPVAQATTQLAPCAMTATTIAATPDRHWRSRTNHTKSAVQHRVSTTCKPRPIVTSPGSALVAVRRSSDAAIAAKGSPTLPSRCPIATSAPVVEPATTRPSGSDDAEGACSFTEKNKSSVQPDSRLARKCAENIFTFACNRPRR